MNSLDLTKILVDKKLIGKGTNVSAKITVSGFGYAPVTREKHGRVTAMSEAWVNILFDNAHRYTKFEDITSIEGMDVARFAQAYGIKIKGKPKKK